MRKKIKLWKITGGIFVIIYIILTIYSFMYDASYDPQYSWDFNGIAPLILTNFPGLAVVWIIFGIFKIKVSTAGAEAAFWITMIVLNTLFYFAVGACTGMVWELIRRKKEDDKGP